MSAFDLTWFNLKKAWYDNEDFRGDPEDEEAHRRGEDEDHQNWLDTSGYDEDVLRLTRPQLDKLMENIQNEIRRRETNKANKNVPVVSNNPSDGG